MSNKVIMLLFFLLLSLFANSQNKIDIKIRNLNKFYKDQRITLDGKLPDIFINKTGKTIDLGEYIIQLENYIADYQAVQYGKKNFNMVRISCLGDNGCIYSNDKETKERQASSNFKISEFNIAFKSKKACYDFINMVDELKQLVLPNLQIQK